MPTKIEGSVMLTKMIQQPLLLQIGSEELFTQYVLELQASPKFEQAQATTAEMKSDEFWDDEDDWVSMLRPYDVQGGVLTIPVKGVLMDKMSFTFLGMMTGYEYIEKAVSRGMGDPDVKAIAFDIDSPGGAVAGNFELVENIVAQRGDKPMYAYANDSAYSAAYSIATAADEIIVARSGGVGSVGVVTAHMDMSERAAAMGVKVTFIFAGKHKVDGNPYQPLPDSVKARIQGRIDRIYGEFVGLVASNRGMEEEAVRATEALTYDASEAVSVGFADRVGAITEMADFSEAQTENEYMTTKASATPAAENTSGQITQATVDTAAATARTEGTAEGASAERERINAIIGSEEGKARPKAAMSAALKTDMTVEQATAFLADLPEEAAAAAPAAAAPVEEPKAAAPAPTPFASNMDGPGVGAEVDAPKEAAKTDSDDILGAFAMQTGRDMRKAS